MSLKSEATRRSFLKNLSMTAAGATLLPASAAFSQSPTGGVVPLRVAQDASGSIVPTDFIGLSYESMQLEDPHFFSAGNRELVQRFRELSPAGILRLGGNTSEFGWWKAHPDMAPPQRAASPWKADGQPVGTTVFAITPEAIDQLDGFLQATGWRCFYGLNLGYGTPEIDIPEAVYVAQKLGPRLASFQVGNEVECFKGHLRDPKTWGPDLYLKQWLEIARAVQKVLPEVRFSLPDVAFDTTWLSAIADNWASIADKPSVIGLSHHYYWNGPPANPEATAENLLKPDSRVAKDARVAREAALKLGPAAGWRMTEGNTIYSGGKEGVSDVLASALWGADYLLTLMRLGYAGAYLHGGSGHAQAVSVGGVLRGEALMKDPNAPHPKPFYTPIANEGTLAGSGVNGALNSHYVLEPVGLGMKFAAAFAGATMLELAFDPGQVNATAYAAKRQDGRILVAVLNKDAAQSLEVSCRGFRVLAQLSGPDIESRLVTLTEADRAASRRLQPRPGTLALPAHTAVLLELE